LLFSAATHVLAKQVLASSPYDPQADFAPVARVGEAPLMLVIAPQSSEKKLTDVLASAKQQPEKWMAAIPASGAPGHLATLLLAKQGGVKFTYVPYKGTQPALVDVAGGHANLLLDSMISVLPLAKAGKVKPVAISSKQRSPLAPDVPTFQESGMPGFSYVSWYGVWAPKGTPADRLVILNAAVNAAVTELGKSGAFATLGIEPVNETPDQFKRYVAADVDQGAELLKSAGFKPE
jgi:tripartite-type tricarboxylate transporter receptor subunit TctC